MHKDRSKVDQTEMPLRSESRKVIRELNRIARQSGLVSRASPDPLFDREFYESRHRDDFDARNNP